MNTPFIVVVSHLLRARFPFLYIPTWEEERVITEIRKLASDTAIIKTPRKVFTWSITTGIVHEGKSVKEETKNPQKALYFIEHFDEPSVFVMKDFHVFFGGTGCKSDIHVIRRLRDLVSVLKTSPRPKNVIFVSPSLLIPDDLQKDITVVDFDLPSYEDILAVLNEMIDSHREHGRVKFNLSDQECERLAKAALGLTLKEAENAFARAMVNDGSLDIADVKIILEEKKQVIKKTQILEFIPSNLDMKDVGGLENLKRWLQKRNKAWLDEAKRYGLPAPKGVLITGVPGCGKSLVSKAVSAMWQLPLLRLDMGSIFGGIVGQSEANIRTAIRTAEAISPSILWIDEIEKGFSGTGSSGDSGTSTRVFSTFLTWMQEKVKPVFVIATANNINILPPELLRKGRFDEIFFVDIPTAKERMEIFKLHIKKRLTDPGVAGDFTYETPILKQLALLTEGFVGSEIEHIVITSLYEAFSEGRSLTLEDFETTIRNTIPLTTTQAEQIYAIRKWAGVRAVSATRKADRLEYNNKLEHDDTNVSAARGGRTIDF